MHLVFSLSTKKHTEQNVERNEGLHKTHQSENREQVCRPKETECIAHIDKANKHDTQAWWVLQSFSFKKLAHLSFEFQLLSSILDIPVNSINKSEGQ